MMRDEEYPDPLIEGIDYNIDDAPAKSINKNVIITLINGPFNGVRYQYTTVRPVRIGSHIRLEFDYDLYETPALPKETLDEFHATVGDVLYSIIKTDN